MKRKKTVAQPELFAHWMIAQCHAQSGALFSLCGHFRWALWRKFAPISSAEAQFMQDREEGTLAWSSFLQILGTHQADWVHFIMLNPSTANAHENDATCRRCMQFARYWGYKGMVVTNLFPEISTSPEYLKKLQPFQLQASLATNREVISAVAGFAFPTICAWGNHGAISGRCYCALPMLVQPQCLGITAKGFPKHPLYVAGKTMPEPFVFGVAPNL